jgi:transposase
MSAAPIIEKAEVRAEQAIESAWKAYQTTAKYGMAFGKACFDFQQKFAEQGQRVKGQGVSPILDKLGIPKSTAYWWIARYKEAEGIADIEVPDSPEEIRHEQVAAKIRQCLEDKSFPTLGVAWAPWKATTDADIAKYGTEPNNDRYRITLFLSQEEATSLSGCERNPLPLGMGSSE